MGDVVLEAKNEKGRQSALCCLGFGGAVLGEGGADEACVGYFGMLKCPKLLIWDVKDYV